jgi:hypothetical protein
MNIMKRIIHYGLILVAVFINQSANAQNRSDGFNTFDGQIFKTQESSLIVNPGFDDNTSVGWEGAGAVNYHVVEFYQKTFNMYQEITGLTAGKYKLTAQAFERPKGNDSGAAYKAGTETIFAQLYAKSTNYSELSTPFNSLYKHKYTSTGSQNGYINTMAAAETMFSNSTNNYYELSVTDILVDEGGTLTIGAKSDFQQGGYWALFDNFQLEYLGVADIGDQKIALERRIKEADYLATQHVQNSAITDLSTSMSQAQAAIVANPLVSDDILTAKATLGMAINTAYTSLNTYAALQKAINDANLILSFLEKTDEITKLQNAIATATESYENLDLTITQINDAITTLKVVLKTVGKQIYIPTWKMGDVNEPSNNWSMERSKQSKNWILFWEPGFGSNPGTTVDDCLALAEKSFTFYADSLKFIKKGASKTDSYKMIIRLRYTTDWEASGSGVDDVIGSLTLTSSALTSRGGQTIAHEVGHCFQYQTHCDNNDQNGWMYGYGANASGGNAWWENCAQWQAYKVFPTQQFTNEWFTGYLNNVHKHLLHEAPRYNNFFIQDYWCDLHGMDMIGRLWNKSIKPEDPVEAYKRLTSITQSKFNDEMWDCAAKFTTWDISALKTLGAGYITSRTQPKMKNTGSYVWRIDSTACPENYGHNIIRLNAPTTAKTIAANFEGLAGTSGFRKNNINYAGWRYGFVALLKDGTRVYSDIKSATMADNAGISNLGFECPANCDKLWFVVSGAPTVHWRHAWDDNDANDEQWPYQVKFNNTNVYGYVNVINAIDNISERSIELTTKGRTLHVNGISTESVVRIYTTLGKCLLTEKVNTTNFTSELPAGIYIISVSSKHGLLTQKVIIW